jgi:hypothetical protein
LAASTAGFGAALHPTRAEVALEAPLRSRLRVQPPPPASVSTTSSKWKVPATSDPSKVRERSKRSTRRGTRSGSAGPGRRCFSGPCMLFSTWLDFVHGAGSTDSAHAYKRGTMNKGSSALSTNQPPPRKIRIKGPQMQPRQAGPPSPPMKLSNWAKTVTSSQWPNLELWS